MSDILINILPINKSVKIGKGEYLIDILCEQGILLHSSCGRRGICGKCLVGIDFQNKRETKKENKILYVKSCQFKVEQDITVYLPQTVLEKEIYKYKKPYQIEIPGILNPLVKTISIPIKEDEIRKFSSYIEFVFNQVGEKDVSISILKKIANIKKDICKSYVLIYDDSKLIDIKKEEEFNGVYGLAIDLGTTSIAIELINLISGETVSELSSLNPQILYGDDIISRISYAIQSEDHLNLLNEKIISGINSLISQVIEEFAIKENDIYDAVIGGNTTMIHLLLGINPSSLGEYPFTPVFLNSITSSQQEIGLHVNPEAKIYIFPSIGGFVGGDITSGLLALNVNRENNSFLFIDLGTNGEIVVSNKGKLWATSTAVGPAFEGGRIQCGMRASIGAIEKIIFIGDDIEIKTIGDVEPEGICGSALIDLLAILLKQKIIDYSGKILSSESLHQNTPENVKRRIKDYNSERVFEVFQGKNKKIILSARDIRQLQLSCSAIKCGIKLLTQQAGINYESLEKIYIAGIFGFHLDKNNLKTIGILPKEIEDEKIYFVGNSSLAGAKYALLNKDIRHIAEELPKKIKHIDLSTIPNFEEEFALSTFFPNIEEKTIN